jgi:hypothetical protein
LPLRRFVFIGVAVVFFFCAAQGAVAAPAEYLVDGWGTEDNLPSSTVTAVAQTPDGYLWVGTYDGLARFDGARFVTFDSANTPELSQPRIQGLFLDVQGTLWINTFRGGLTSYRNGIFREELPDQPTFDLHTTLVSSTSNLVVFVTQFGEVLSRDPAKTGAAWDVVVPPDARPIFQCADADGKLWFLPRDGHILQFAAGKFKALPDDGGLAGSQIYKLVADARGKIWAGAENEIARWDGRQFEAMTPTNGEADVHPQLLFPTQAGALWVLDGDRLRKMIAREWVAEAAPWRGLLGPASGRAMGAHEDRDGGLWFNHYGNGLFHITPDGQFQRLTSQDNLPSDQRGCLVSKQRRRGLGGRDARRAGAAAEPAFSCDWRGGRSARTDGVVGLRRYERRGLDRHRWRRVVPPGRWRDHRVQGGHERVGEFYFFHFAAARRRRVVERGGRRRFVSILRRPDSARVVGCAWHQMYFDRPRGARLDRDQIGHRAVGG